MNFRLEISGQAQFEIENFLARLEAFQVSIAARERSRLADALRVQILERYNTWPYFFVTGPPYRAYLFAVSRRTAFWMIYRVDEEARTIRLLRFWDARRNPRTLEL